jgi:hypothetical protein
MWSITTRTKAESKIWKYFTSESTQIHNKAKLIVLQPKNIEVVIQPNCNSVQELILDNLNPRRKTRLGISTSEHYQIETTQFRERSE